MQPQDQAGRNITITRAAAQQMMHFSLGGDDNATPPLCGTAYDNGHGCITRVTPPQAPCEQGCATWISHPGLDDDALAQHCATHGDGGLFLLLDTANKGRLDLRAAWLDRDGRRLDPVPITMVEE